MKSRYLLLLLLLLIACSYSIYRIQYTPYQNPIDITQVPTFTTVPIPFTHDYKHGNSLPFAGGAIIDIDNDNVPEVFTSGGYLQRDGLYTYKDGQFKDISKDSGLSKDIGDTSYGAASIDVNADGHIDLFVTRDSGLYLYLNQGGFFVKHKLNVNFSASETPIAVALADVNRDGLIDLFVSCFQAAAHRGAFPFRTQTYPGSNKLLLNAGEYVFQDVTASAGLPDRKSAYAATFTDLNNDGWMDLIVAYQAEPPAIYQNVNGSKFSPIHIDTLSNMAFARAIAVGDVNNDMLPDLLFTTSGSTLPEWLLRKTLNRAQAINTEWVLLQNKGGFDFENAANRYLLASYEMATSAVFADLNLDGAQDLIAGQNDPGFFPYWIYQNPGKLLIQKNGDNFAPAIEDAHISNRHFAVAPLLADFNRDGYIDLVWLNIDDPASAFINNGGNSRYLQIDLGDRPEALGAKITLQTNDGLKQYLQQTGGAGSLSDSSHIQTFAVMQQAIVEDLTIQYLDGRATTLTNVDSNQILSLKPAALPTAKKFQEPPPEPIDSEIEELVQQPAEPAPAETVIKSELDEFDDAAFEEELETAKPPPPSIEDELEDLLAE